jgi:hypothetical protein
LFTTAKVRGQKKNPATCGEIGMAIGAANRDRIFIEALNLRCMPDKRRPTIAVPAEETTNG